jgi:hypothetical protein
MVPSNRWEISPEAGASSELDYEWPPRVVSRRTAEALQPKPAKSPEEDRNVIAFRSKHRSTANDDITRANGTIRMTKRGAKLVDQFLRGAHLGGMKGEARGKTMVSIALKVAAISRMKVDPVTGKPLTEVDITGIAFRRGRQWAEDQRKVHSPLTAKRNKEIFEKAYGKRR